MRTPSIDLSECWAKLGRADEHRETLKAEVSPVLNGEAHRIQIVGMFDPESGYYVFRVAAIPQAWRLRVGVILGDIVHNLRSALDYLYWQLYCHFIRIPKSMGERSQVQFPIVDRSQGLANKREHVRKIPSSYWAVIDAAQPYNRTSLLKSALRALGELSNRDKHRSLTPVLMRTAHMTFDDMSLISRATSARDMSRAGKYLEVGAEVVRMRFPKDMDTEMKMIGRITPGIRLPEGDFQILHGVDLMIRRVGIVINDTEALL